jgi:hypothetical protein
MKKIFSIKQRVPVLALFLAAFFCLSPLYGDRAPINVNLIIDGSDAFFAASGEITSWVNNRLDQILVDGDRVTIWNAGSSARVVYSNTIGSSEDREAAKRSVRELASGTADSSTADFSGALREAARLQSSSFSYTLLVSASAETLSSVLESPEASLLRFSRVEEFSSWRALVVGLNLDTRVRRAAAAYFGS